MRATRRARARLCESETLALAPCTCVRAAGATCAHARVCVPRARPPTRAHAPLARPHARARAPGGPARARAPTRRARAYIAGAHAPHALPVCARHPLARSGARMSLARTRARGRTCPPVRSMNHQEGGGRCWTPRAKCPSHRAASIGDLAGRLQVRTPRISPPPPAESQAKALLEPGLRFATMPAKATGLPTASGIARIPPDGAVRWGALPAGALATATGGPSPPRLPSQDGSRRA